MILAALDKSDGDSALGTPCVAGLNPAGALERCRPHRHRFESCPQIPAVAAAAPPVHDCARTPGSHHHQEPRRTRDSLARLCLAPPDPVPSPESHPPAHNRPPSSLATWLRTAASAARQSVPPTAPSANAESPLHGAREKSSPNNKTTDDRHNG